MESPASVSSSSLYAARNSGHAVYWIQRDWYDLIWTDQFQANQNALDSFTSALLTMLIEAVDCFFNDLTGSGTLSPAEFATLAHGHLNESLHAIREHVERASLQHDLKDWLLIQLIEPLEGWCVAQPRATEALPEEPPRKRRRLNSQAPSGPHAPRPSRIEGSRPTASPISTAGGSQLDPNAAHLQRGTAAVWAVVISREGERLFFLVRNSREFKERTPFLKGWRGGALFLGKFTASTSASSRTAKIHVQFNEAYQSSKETAKAYVIEQFKKSAAQAWPGVNTAVVVG